jgi:hypothetical protein
VSGTATALTDPAGLEGEWPTDLVPKGTSREEIEDMINKAKQELSQCGNNAACRKQVKERIRKLNTAKKLATPSQKKRIENKNTKRRGTVNTKLLRRLAVASCVAACAKIYDNCLDRERTVLESCIKGFNHVAPCGGKIGDDSICYKDYRLGVAECVTKATACKLACLLPW